MADKKAERIAELIKPLRVKPGSKVNLAKDFDPDYKAGFVKKEDGRQLLRTGIELLADYWPTTSGGWPPRTPTGCWCACRRWMPAARTARSAM
jgi:hypothetical protein